MYRELWLNMVPEGKKRWSFPHKKISRYTRGQSPRGFKFRFLPLIPPHISQFLIKIIFLKNMCFWYFFNAYLLSFFFFLVLDLHCCHADFSSCGILVPCIGRQTLNLWTTREVLFWHFYDIYRHFCKPPHRLFLPSFQWSTLLTTYPVLPFSIFPHNFDLNENLSSPATALSSLPMKWTVALALPLLPLPPSAPAHCGRPLSIPLCRLSPP